MPESGHMALALLRLLADDLLDEARQPQPRREDSLRHLLPLLPRMPA